MRQGVTPMNGSGPVASDIVWSAPGRAGGAQVPGADQLAMAPGARSLPQAAVAPQRPTRTRNGKTARFFIEYPLHLIRSETEIKGRQSASTLSKMWDRAPDGPGRNGA